MTGQNQRRYTRLAAMLVATMLSGCATDTYVSQENRDKFDNVDVGKFLISECMQPNRQVQVATISHFDFDKAKLKAADQAALNQLIASIEKLSGQVSIIGHTDVQGSSEYNLALSLERAKAVERYMKTQLNDEQYQWEIKYYGKSKPANLASSQLAHRQNRRAYIVFEETMPSGMAGCEALVPERQVNVAITPHFDFDRSDLSHDAKLALDELIANIEGQQGRILIAGHTDVQGSQNYNHQLAMKRAMAVQDYLRQHLSAQNFRWELKSFGEQAPISNQQTQAANALNRRAVVIFKQTH